MLSIDEKDRLISDYDKGLTMVQLSTKYNISRQQIWSITKWAGCKPRRSVVSVICPCCGKLFVKPEKKQTIYCSQACYIKHQLGNQDSAYNKECRKKALSNRQHQRISRKVVSTFIDLQPDYVVHHLNGDITNSDPSNLFVFYSHSLHLKYHHRLRKDKRCLPYGFIDGVYLV